MSFNDAIYSMTQRFCHGVLNTLFRVDLIGTYHVPNTGGFIVASNHVSYFDPPAVGAGMARNTYYFARKSLFRPGFAGWFMEQLHTIPVDRDGGSDVTALKRSLQTLKDGHGLLVFPEGKRSETGELLPAKQGIGLMACKTQVPIVPIRIFGTFEALPRGKAWPDLEQTVTVIFDKPLYPKDYDTGPRNPDRYQHASECVMDAIRAIQPRHYPVF